MIDMRNGQMTIAEVFFQHLLDDWWESWMKQADRILASCRGSISRVSRSYGVVF